MQQLRPLEPDRLYARCDPAQFDFATTAELQPLDTVLGQPRALEALRFGVGIRRPGYHIYALGPPGTGKRTLVRLILDERAAHEPPSADLCYVNNFDAPHRPRLLRLPAGTGERLRRDVDRLLEDVRSAIPAVFETEEYRTRRREIEESLKEQQQRAFEELGREADSRGIALVRTPAGMAFAPMRKGEVIGPDEFQALPESERQRVQAVIASFDERLERLMQQIHQWRREAQERVRELDREVATSAVRHVIDDLRRRYDALAPVEAHLDRLERAIVENYEDFRRGEEGLAPLPFGMPMAVPGSPLRRYRVNVLVDRSGDRGAPVVHEDHPTFHNLLGRIEHVAQMGALVTDFALIKAGALHRANGGYLLLDARKVLMHPFAWEGLKRALDTRELRIESLGQALSLVCTVSLEPEPAPFEVKVVLLGDRLLYYLLYQFDPDFAELFKVAADFEDDMDRDAAAPLAYARLIAGLATKERLLAFDRYAVARTIEHAARLAEDAARLSLRVRELADLLREADYWAREAGRDAIALADVEHAIDAKVYRLDRIRARVQEQIDRRLLLIETRGSRIGQVNGLSLAQLGDFAFGHPARITARVRPGKGDLLDIQREVELGGPIHSKGVLILSGFLGGRYLPDRPLAMSASLVFEQTYGEVEGDSASCAELCALLSALAEVPLRQSLAVTGSINQYGDVQAIGGVNEKIEGFFDVCRRRGLTGEEGVLIPAASVQHLMLRADVVAAAAEGRFRIYALNHIDEGLELLAGRPAGSAGRTGCFPRKA